MKELDYVLEVKRPLYYILSAVYRHQYVLTQ